MSAEKSINLEVVWQPLYDTKHIKGSDLRFFAEADGEPPYVRTLHVYYARLRYPKRFQAFGIKIHLEKMINVDKAMIDFIAGHKIMWEMPMRNLLVTESTSWAYSIGTAFGPLHPTLLEPKDIKKINPKLLRTIYIPPDTEFCVRINGLHPDDVGTKIQVQLDGNLYRDIQ